MHRTHPLLTALAATAAATTLLALPALATEGKPSLSPPDATSTIARLGGVVDAQPTPVRPTPTVRPERETLAMKCAGRIVQSDAGRSKAATCAWRPTTNRAARGYQLWRIIDGGGRELAWSGGLESLEAATRVPLDAGEVTFVVLAVDADGAVLGRSRPQTVTFPMRGVGPVDRRKLDGSAAR